MAIPPPAPPVVIGDVHRPASGDYIVKKILEYYDKHPNTRLVVVKARGVLTKFIGGVGAPKLGVIAMRDDGEHLRIASVHHWSELKARIDAWLVGFEPVAGSEHASDVMLAQDRVNQLEDELTRARQARNVALAKAVDAGYTQYALADVIGESRGNVSRWTNAARY